MQIQFLSSLDIAAMFYHAAINNLEQAISSKEIADAADKELDSISWRNGYEMYDLGDEIDVSFSNEQITYIEGLKDKVKSSHSLFLQATATVQIFCVASLESHINKTGVLSLHGKLLDQFEKLSLEGKWLFLPRLLDKKSFDPGLQPFQDFTLLIKVRNALVHYKGKKIPYNLESNLIDLYKPLGLTIEDAQRSIETTKKMILKLSEILSVKHPSWIAGIASDYLQIETVIKEK